jgi:hypothetical protein
MLHKCIQVLIECVGKCGLKGKGWACGWSMCVRLLLVGKPAASPVCC